MRSCRSVARLLLTLLLLTPATGRAQRCAPDAALTLAAAELSLHGALPDARGVIAIARAEGAEAPVLDAAVLTEARRDAFVDRAVSRFGDTVICGEARRDGRVWIVAGPREGQISLADDGRVRVSLRPGLTSPRLHVLASDGELWQREARADEWVELPADLARPLTVQLVAADAEGPRPVAERVIGERPASTTVRSDEPVRARVAMLREHASVGPLRGNRLLEREAGRHAAQICRAGRARHVSEDGDPERRLERAGVRARHVGEAIARAEDRDAAWAALRTSPSHRAALTDRRFTDVGVGEAEGGRCVVVLLAAWPRVF